MPELLEKEKPIRLSEAANALDWTPTKVFRLDQVQNPTNISYADINDPDSVAQQKRLGLWDQTKFFLGEAVIKPFFRDIKRFPAKAETLWQAGVDSLRGIAQDQLTEDGAVFGASKESFQARTPEQKARIDQNNKMVESFNRAEDVSKRLQANWLEYAESGFTARDMEV